jgi:hypothetical protein
MPTSAELTDWAARHASELERDMTWRSEHDSYSGRGYWTSDEASAQPKIRARAIAALDFLERFSGHDSQWAIRGHEVFEEQGETLEAKARSLADVLRAWAEAVTAGMVVPRQVETLGARAVASTDLMEQVRVLAADRDIHPAAPIVLAGAALEVALRSAVEEFQLELKEKPSITAYARRLRTDHVLSAQDVKDVEQMAGIRNSAAHGNFDDLSRERAGLMEQQVNLFLRRLSELLEHPA